MTINEAYNKGLDDAEAKVLEILPKAVMGIDEGVFANPALEEFRKQLVQSATVEVGDVSIPDSFVEKFVIKGILLNQGISCVYSQTKDTELVALKELMDFIYGKAYKGNNGSKNYRLMIENIQKTLTSGEGVVN